MSCNAVVCFGVKSRSGVELSDVGWIEVEKWDGSEWSGEKTRYGLGWHDLI